MVNRGNFKKKHASVPVPVEQDDTDYIQDKPTCLHVSIENQIYSGAGITKGFQQAGFDVHQMNWQPIKFEETVEGLRARLINYAAINRPDYIFLHIQNEGVLDVDTCKVLTEYCKTVLYNFDCREKEKSQWMYDLATHLSLVCFSNQEDVNNCLALGIENVMALHSACDIDLYARLPFDVKYTSPDIVFIGGQYLNSNLNFPLAEERLKMTNFLEREYSDRFGAFGIGNSNNARFINSMEEVRIYNASKIAINQNNFEREGYTSDRIWRIMSTGTFCLTKWFPGIDKIFEKEIHLDWFNTFEEMKGLLEFYLNEDEERGAIAQMGSRFVRENHSWKSRVEEIKNKLS